MNRIISFRSSAAKKEFIKRMGGRKAGDGVIDATDTALVVDEFSPYIGYAAKNGDLVYQITAKNAKFNNVEKGKLVLINVGNEYKVKDLTTGKIYKGFDNKAEAEEFIELHTDEDLRTKTSNAFQNGKAKAQNAIAKQFKACNIAIYVVEGQEFYGGTVQEAAHQWMRSHGKSTCRVTSPGSVAGTYEATAGGSAVKV